MNDSSYIILRWTFMREGIFFLKKSKPTMFQPKMRMVSERERIGVYYVLTFYVGHFHQSFLFGICTQTNTYPNLAGTGE